MKFDPVGTGFGVIIHSVDLKGPGLSGTVRDLEHILDDHQLVILRSGQLDLSEYVRFGRQFGTLEHFDFGPIKGNTIRISNTGEDGSVLPADSEMRRNIAADALWHTDHTYRPVRARYSVLKAEVLPRVGGETQFANTRLAYAALAQDMKQRLEGLVAIHSIIYSRALAGFTGWTDEQRAALPPIPQPLVFVNPRTNAKSLYVASHIAEILGMPTGEARELVRELMDFATQEQFVYNHSWREDDIVIWDNRATMHRRAPYDDLNEERTLHTMRIMEPSDLYDGETVYEIN